MLILLLIGSSVHAQDDEQNDNHLSSLKGESSLGIGIGLPYGALGFRFGTNVADNLNLFGGIGYQLVGVGYNFGILKDFKSSGSTQFYVLGMYGTNAAIVIEGADEFDEIYTGATFGLGIKINSRKTEGNFWDIGLLAPIRSSDYKDDADALDNNPLISDFTEPWPILITVGYNFNL